MARATPNSAVKGIWLGDGVQDCMEQLLPQVQTEKIAMAFILPRLVDSSN